MTVQDGDTAPDFTLPDDSGGQISLSDFRGRKLVLYFYPRDDTPGCTTEALDFTAKAGEFKAVDTAIVGISKDSAVKHGKFRDKHNLGIPLASDAEGSACEDYGVWVEKNMYGKKSMGIERSTFLIDRDGKIARSWRKVKVKGHVDEVLEAAQALS